MKYILNEDSSCGNSTLPDETRTALLEALGYTQNEEEVVEEGTAGAAPKGAYKNIGQDAQDKLEERGKKGKKDDDNGDPRAFGGKKGDKSKTRKGKDFEKNGDDDENGDDDNGDFRAFGRKKGDKSKTHKGKDFEKESQEPDENPSLYEWDNDVFALDSEVFEIDGSFFLKALELDNETKHGLDESHAELFVNVVEFDEGDYTLGDIYDLGEEIYIKMDEWEGRVG